MTQLVPLVEDMENTLDRLFISGLGVVEETDVNNLKELSSECSRHGLGLGAKILQEMADKWEQKRHSLATGATGLVKDICVLDVYLSLLRSKLDIARIQASLTEQGK